MVGINIGADSLPRGELDKYELFRRNKYRHLYFCPNCVKNFETVEPTNKCKFCDGEIRELPRTEKKILPMGTRYRYFCPKCEKNFESEFKHEECQICGHKMIHFYRWEELGLRDRIFIRLFKIFRYSKPKVKEETKAEFKMPTEFKMPKFTLPQQKFNLPQFSSPKFSFGKEEELPTK